MFESERVLGISYLSSLLGSSGTNGDASPRGPFRAGSLLCSEEGHSLDPSDEEEEQEQELRRTTA
eukprot:9476949-Pyramimonas_sp.AAC.1